MKRVYIVIEHARFPYGLDVRYMNYGKVAAVFENKQDAKNLVALKDPEKIGEFSVITKLVRSE